MVSVWLTGLPVQPSCCQNYVSYRSQKMQGVCQLPVLLDMYASFREKVDLKLQCGIAFSSRVSGNRSLGRSLGINAYLKKNNCISPYHPYLILAEID